MGAKEKPWREGLSSNLRMGGSGAATAATALAAPYVFPLLSKLTAFSHLWSTALFAKSY